MTWKEFESKAVPEDIRLRESQKNVFVPLSRWVSTREAFVLHHLGVTGNMVSLFRVVLAVLALLLYAKFADGDLELAIAGVALMIWQLNLDGVDGALARAQDNVSDFGNALDNLGIDYARTCFWVLVGAMTGDIRMVVLTVLTGHLLVPFRQSDAAAGSGKVDRLVGYLTYIPVLWVIVPVFMVVLLAAGVPAVSITYGVAWFYVTLALIWFVACLCQNLLQPTVQKQNS